MYSVVISNGVFRFHLVSAAVEAARRGTLELFLTGAYPKGPLSAFLKKWLGNSPAARRLVDRADNGLSESNIVSVWCAEFVIQAGVTLGGLLKSRATNDRLQALGLSVYGRIAARAIRGASSDIYHYRAGYGGRSIEIARSSGAVCLCDHSVVSPLTLDYMVSNSGQLPPADMLSSIRLSAMWKTVLDDIEAADHVLVNSRLVKSTLMHHGVPGETITVIYQGIDAKFLQSIPAARPVKATKTLLFAGEIARRKGFDSLIAALGGIPEDEWELIVAGGTNETTEAEYRRFLLRPNVRHVGFVSRTELARLMSESAIFVFPTLAEGSARVIFEAMACECYVITTPNAGSIVETGRHGELIQPGDVAGLRDAIRRALTSSTTAEIGARNGRLIREEYMQSDYGVQLDGLYQDLVDGRKALRRRIPEEASAT